MTGDSIGGEEGAINDQIDGEEEYKPTREEVLEQSREYVKALLGAMRQIGASDLFISSGFRPSVKHNGEMKALTDQVMDDSDSETLAMSIMNKEQIAEFEKDLECNFAISEGELGRFRVNVYIQQKSVAMVIRTIAEQIPTIEGMNLPEILKNLSLEKRGLVLLVGGTGSGKSTTLAAMVDHRNSNQAGHIITIEDPVEYAHKPKLSLISHREVGVDTKSWHNALKNTLRQAPDVVLIGEIRDAETMEHAIALSETGHLCMSTLHANNANQALDRIINFFPEERRNQILMDLASNMKAIVSQRLPRTVSGLDRAAAVEIMINSQAISERILKGEFHELKGLMAKSENIGMRTFDNELFKMYESGQIPFDEAIKNSDHPNELRLNIKLKSRTAKNDKNCPFYNGAEGDDADVAAAEEIAKKSDGAAAKPEQSSRQLAGSEKPVIERKPIDLSHLSLEDIDGGEDPA